MRRTHAQQRHTVRYHKYPAPYPFGICYTAPKQPRQHRPAAAGPSLSQVFAYLSTQYYRDAYGMFAATAILFNHESECRPMSFVTRKITAGVARIAKGDPAPLELGNMDARRDWGHAEDYCRAMWTILQVCCARWAGRQGG